MKLIQLRKLIRETILTEKKTVQYYSTRTSALNNGFRFDFTIKDELTDETHYPVYYKLTLFRPESGHEDLLNQTGYINFKTKELFFDKPLNILDFTSKKYKILKKVKLTQDAITYIWAYAKMETV